MKCRELIEILEELAPVSKPEMVSVADMECVGDLVCRRIYVAVQQNQTTEFFGSYAKFE